MKNFILYTLCITYHKFPLGKGSSEIIVKNLNCYTDQNSAISDLTSYVTTINMYMANNTNIKPAYTELFKLKKVSDTTYATESSNAPVVSVSIITNTLECIETSDLSTILDNIV